MNNARLNSAWVSRNTVCGLVAILVGWVSVFSHRVSAEDAVASPPKPPPQSVEPQPATKAETPAKPDEAAKELVSGKVVLLLDALKQRGIKATVEMKGQVVLETESGELWPLVADWRGRAFFQDERLRNRPVDLVVRRTKGSPYLQVLMLFTFNEEGERQYTDYWCDICSIPMYEIKDCECCQGPIRLRFQKQNLPDYLKPSEKKK